MKSVVSWVFGCFFVCFTLSWFFILEVFLGILHIQDLSLSGKFSRKVWKQQNHLLFEHNVVWDSLYCALYKMSIHMIPLVEILIMLLFYCVMTNHFKDELLFSAKTCNLRLHFTYEWIYLSGITCDSSLIQPVETYYNSFVLFFLLSLHTNWSW